MKKLFCMTAGAGGEMCSLRMHAEDAMQEPLAGEVNERRAAALIGLSSADLRSLAREAALGKSSEASPELIFTFEELRRLCLLAHSAHL